MKQITFLVALGLFSLPTSAAAQIVCGTADDTASIQAAIDAATVPFNPVAEMRPVQFPPGPCYVTSLNVTERAGLALLGPTQLIPIQSGAVVMDLSGSANILLRLVAIAGGRNLAVQPAIGLLLSQITGPWAGWSNVIRLDYVQVDGDFSIGSLFVLGVASSSIAHSQFTQYAGHPDLSPGHAGVNAWFTGGWWGGNLSPYQEMDLETWSGPTDWTITGTEFHNFGAQAALWVGGAQGMRFYGGNLSSQDAPAVDLHAVAVNGQTIVPANLIFDGTTFYADFGVHGPCAIRSSVGTDALHLRANTVTFPAVTCG